MIMLTLVDEVELFFKKRKIDFNFRLLIIDDHNRIFTKTMIQIIFMILQKNM